MISSKIIADSINSATGDRLTTYIVKFNRFILAEVNTHRVLSRNSASSRAIPLKKIIEQIRTEIATPVYWGSSQPGMQSGAEIPPEDIVLALEVWKESANLAIEQALKLDKLKVHKSISNRLLEPFLFHTALVTATDYHNFFALRAHKDAQPEFQCLAYLMLEQYLTNVPKLLNPGEWHIPFSDKFPEGASHEDKLKIASARAARLSYLTFDGEMNTAKDIELHDSLIAPGHCSPFEHPAMATEDSKYYGNFKGFKQYRKFIPNENRDKVDLHALLANRPRFK